jgi:hypothetical protein
MDKDGCEENEGETPRHEQHKEQAKWVRKIVIAPADNGRNSFEPC